MWIARDKNELLCLFKEKPFFGRGKEYYITDSLDYIILDNDLFTEVTFENSPVEVELKIKTK